MTVKKRKGSGRRRKILPLFFLIIGLSSLTCIFLLSVYLFTVSTTVRVGHPVFEEIYSTTSDLHEGITKIDLAIYEGLFRSGTRERDIQFVNVQPRHGNGHIWDFTELSVRCVDLGSALSLQKIVTHELSTLGMGIKFQLEEGRDKDLICHIFVKNSYTHKIVLSFDSYGPPARDLRPKIAIIIDDLGYDSAMASSLIQLDLPLTFSVLPAAPYTERIAQEAHETGCEVMLHLPMEPKNYPSVNPGPGALFLSMEEHEIREVLGQNLRNILGVRGVNNHMGSAFTENRDKVLVVLKELKKRNLFYIDSRTTSNTVGFTLAAELGVPVAGRSVFLDNDLAPKAIEMQMERLLSVARHSGTAVGIAHPHKETLRVLEKYYLRIKTDFHVVPVSELVS